MGWDGAVNAWHVAGGVYRMGRREWLTETGWQQAYDDGVRTVVDLRHPREALRRDTDPAVADRAWSGVNDVVLPPPKSPAIRGSLPCAARTSTIPPITCTMSGCIPQKLVGVFRAVAAATGAVVIHCAAGRDRSGMVAAMIQDLAGHSDQLIADGYSKAARGINERYRTHGPPHARERYLADAELAPLLEERGRTVVKFVRDLDTRAFLLENGLSEEEIADIKRLAGGRVPL